MNPIRLHVLMPQIGVFEICGRTSVGEVEDLVETMVDRMKRQEFKGALVEGSVWVRAFAPDQFRFHLRESKRLIDGEYVWCIAKLSDNKKSLAPFIASGDLEWKTGGAA